MENENAFETAMTSYIVLFLTKITYIKFIWSQKANLCVQKKKKSTDGCIYMSNKSYLKDTLFGSLFRHANKKPQ